jgi:hypothetical protein
MPTKGTTIRSVKLEITGAVFGRKSGFKFRGLKKDLGERHGKQSVFLG